MFPADSSWRIVRGDMVQIMVGKDKGKRGEVLRVIRDRRFPRVFVSGLNMITRRIPSQVDRTGNEKKGFAVRMEAPIHYSNVMLLDPQSQMPVRTYFRYEDTEGGKRVRFTRGKHATNCIVPWPQKWKDDITPNPLVGEKDTRPDVAQEVTYDPENDFTMVLPSAHHQLRQLRNLRDKEAAAKAAAKQQQQKEYRLLFRSKADAPAAAAGRSRGYSSFASSSSSSSSNSNSWELQVGSSSSSSLPMLLPLLQSSRALGGASSSSSRGSLAARLVQLHWAGLAAAPYLLK